MILHFHRKLPGVLALVLCTVTLTGAEPVVDQKTVFQEKDGILAVEAEHFYKQTQTDKRAFHLTHSERTPRVTPDGDQSHVAGASGGAYLEILPDTRRTHADKLIRLENFSPEPGKMAILHYRVNISTPGKYYVWVRAFSTGSEDNGLHVGIDGRWPASGQRLQWCEGKHSWRWDSKQRTEKNHCGEPHKIFLQIDEPGEHEIMFSMREDGFEFDKWLMTTQRNYARPAGIGPASVANVKAPLPSFPFVAAVPSSADANAPAKLQSPTRPVSDKKLQMPRGRDGDGKSTVTGELKTWHKITVDLNGPYAHEYDNQPNPFTDYEMRVQFRHADGTQYVIPGFFACDGDAANSGSQSGIRWRAHFAPDRPGQWNYEVAFRGGRGVALGLDRGKAQALAPFHGAKGSFVVSESDKNGRDLRAHGRLNYVGKRYLQFAQSGKYFLKAGADAPETLLAYKDFDNTVAGNPKKAPLKSWSRHQRDWKQGDPTWKDNQGKGLIGAVNYLSGKGCNVFSFLTYNAGGDGDNVWPFVHRDDKLHYDCSKLDQWGIVLDHAMNQGMYLHFKMQETENDDHLKGGKDGGTGVPESLDGGNLGPQRRLYCRELIARFGHLLALNWNLGEENTQSTSQQIDMINYIDRLDAYDHLIVVHTYPSQQEKVYRPLIGDKSKLTGVSLQNSSLETTHEQTVRWVEESTASGKPWVVAFDESGSAAHAQCPDLGYNGFDGHDRKGEFVYTQHRVRKLTLWGTLMAGGAGNEYYFGYQFDQNDIVCEDWRSRDQSWDYCRIAIEFFHKNKIPFWEMNNADALVGNGEHRAGTFCFCKPGDVYLVYLPDGGTASLDLREDAEDYSVAWFNPRTGGPLTQGSVEKVSGKSRVALGDAPNDPKEDWLIVLRKLPQN